MLALHDEAIRNRNATLDKDSREPFPTTKERRALAKAGSYALHSQSVQEIIDEYGAAVRATISKRKKAAPGDGPINFPAGDLTYRNVPYKNNQARVRIVSADDSNKESEGFSELILPNGPSGTLRIRLSPKCRIPGRLLRVSLGFNEIFVVYEIPPVAKEETARSVVGVDLGVNTLIAATDGRHVVQVSGRAVKSNVQWRNKRLAEIQECQSRKTEHSRRWNRLQKQKHRLLDKCRRKQMDYCHQATAIIKQVFPGSSIVVGKPFNEAAQKMGKRTAQLVSQSCNRRLIDQLAYKMNGAVEVNEAYTSQTCPYCLHRQKCRRLYRCSHCGYTAPRDTIGAINIRTVGITGGLRKSDVFPETITYRRL